MSKGSTLFERMSALARGSKHIDLGLPIDLPGHWSTQEGLYMAAEYAAKDRTDLAMGDRSDLQLANDQFLASRDSLDLIHFQTAAKDRIRWLSVQLALARAELDARKPPEPSDQEKDDAICHECKGTGQGTGGRERCFWCDGKGHRL